MKTILAQGINRKIFIVYLSIGAVGLILLLTNYSFTWDIFDYLIIGVLIGYPIVMFFRYFKPLWLKITITLFLLIGLSLAGYYVLIYAAFETAGDKEEIENWTIGNFKVELTYRQDWAGPAHYRYDLKKTIIFGVFEKTLAYSYPGTSLSDTCVVGFKEFYYGDTIYTFDKCEQTIKKVK